MIRNKNEVEGNTVCGLGQSVCVWDGMGVSEAGNFDRSKHWESIKL